LCPQKKPVKREIIITSYLSENQLKKVMHYYKRISSIEIYSIIIKRLQYFHFPFLLSYNSASIKLRCD
jgi:hypothetical protein